MSFQEDVKKWASEALNKGGISLVGNIPIGTTHYSEYDLYSNYLTALDRYKDAKVSVTFSPPLRTGLPVSLRPSIAGAVFLGSLAGLLSNRHPPAPLLAGNILTLEDASHRACLPLALSRWLAGLMAVIRSCDPPPSSRALGIPVSAVSGEFDA